MSAVKTKEVSFFSGPSLRMAGRMYLPEPEVDLRAGVLFCHGFGSVKEGVPVGLSTHLAKAGYTVMSFDYRGFGQSEGPRGLLSPAEQVEDALHAIEFLAQCPNIDPTRIGLYGTSFGGGIAAIVAARSRWVRALVVTVPVMSGRQWLQSMTRRYEFVDLTSRAYEALAKKVATGEILMVDRSEIMLTDPVTHETRIRGRKIPISLETVHHLLHHEPLRHACDLRMPVLMNGLQNDTVVPFDQTEAFFSQLKGLRKLNTFDHSDHWAVYDVLLPQVAEETLAWFSEHVLRRPLTQI